MDIVFYKMHGLGNDFIVLDLRSALNFIPNAVFLKKLADRKHGLGCDQIILLHPPRQPHLPLRLAFYNADGTQANACGNALRCIGAWQLKNHPHLQTLCLETALRTYAIKKGAQKATQVNMGKPSYLWNEIPLLKPDLNPLALSIDIGPIKQASAISMGNPHMIYFAKNLDDIDLAKLGPDLEHHPLFPQRCNVEMVQIIDDHRLAMRVWERGTGLTLACGTGACAVVAAYLLTKRSDLYGHWIHVDMPGGSLRIQWDNIEGDMWMEGPTQQVAQGILDASFVK